LLEALSLAGGLPADTRLSFLNRCMIVRGNDMLIWVDLRELLERGNLNLNTRLQNGDFIYIPQSEDQLAYIMGEVPNPGVMVLRSEMTLLDAVMRSGGPTLDADDTKVYLIRNVDGKGYVRRVDFRDMYQAGDMRGNYILKDGDIVYVSRSRLGGFNAFLTQMQPGMDAIDFTINTAEAFGAMAELRNKLWGQEGFINRTGVSD
jgi:polysaccharide export outer membrane protein